MLSSAELVAASIDSSPIVSPESRRFQAQEFNWLPRKCAAVIVDQWHGYLKLGPLNTSSPKCW